MQFFFLGTEPVDVKVKRDNKRVDTVTILPSKNAYQTHDVELVNAALENPLFVLELPKPEPVAEAPAPKKGSKKEEAGD